MTECPECTAELELEPGVEEGEAVVTIEGTKAEPLEGRRRVVLGVLEGSGGSAKVSWLVRGKEGSTVRLRVHSFSAGTDTREIVLKGGDGR